jgi:hypothetical protein
VGYIDAPMEEKLVAMTHALSLVSLSQLHLHLGHQCH